MYKPNPISRFSSWLVKFLAFDRWTAVHCIAGASIGFVLKHIRLWNWSWAWNWIQWIMAHISNPVAMMITLAIAVWWEFHEKNDYSTVEEMYRDYGGKKSYWKNTIVDVIVAMLMSYMVVY